MTTNDDTRIAVAIAPGETFAGRYEIQSELGSGGMGKVYKALDTLAGDVVALKVMHSHLARNAALVKQFTRELSNARKLAHPNIARIHDIGEAEGVMFLSMEYIDGRTIAAILQSKGRFGFEEFLPLFFQISNALECVHAAKLVHRDVKPLNVMVDRAGAAKLMDFGIAGDVDGGGPAVIGGTPAYMAPEVAAGETAGPPSDIYSAGVMFFEMLTGGKPGDQPFWEDADDVPEEMRKIVTRAIEGDPNRRFRTVKEMIEAARKFGQPAAPAKAATLAELLRDEPANPGSVLPTFAAVVDAFVALHASCSAHECPAPEKIRVRDDGSVQVDGLRNAAGATVVFSNGKYAAPELFADGGKATQCAVDAYVLGFIFYEILLGRRLFAQAISGITNDVGWLRWHASAQQTAPGLSEILPAIPAAIAETIAAMMSKRADARLQDFNEIGRRLSGASTEAQQTVWAANTSAEEKAVKGSIRKEKKRRGWPKIAAIAAGLLLVASGAIAFEWYRNVPVPSPPPVPRVPDEGLQAPAQLPDAIDTPSGPMLLVGGGDFLMGNDSGRQSEDFGYLNEAPAHQVSVPSFYIDKFEVTNGQYRVFCDASGRDYPRAPAADPMYFDRADRPVINVSWEDARAFAAWAKKRLPTEAEWEKAARGTDGRRFPWGNEYIAPKPRAEGGLIGPVGTVAYDRSPYGAMDLAGNVAEWVEDAYGLYAGNTGALPVSEQGQKVVRGVWFDLDPRVAAITNRGSGDPVRLHGESYIGFRCAMDVPVQKTSGGTK